MLKQYPSFEDLKKFTKAKMRKEKRKALKNKPKQEVENKFLGTWFMAKTMTGLVPFNEHGRTSYLIGSGITVLAEKTKSGYRIYLTCGRTITTKKELLELVERKVIKKPVIARSYELSIIRGVDVK